MHNALRNGITDRDMKEAKKPLEELGTSREGNSPAIAVLNPAEAATDRLTENPSDKGEPHVLH